LNEEQRNHFQDYIHAGGGFVGVHMGIATKREWPWYEQLVGRSFRIHPYVQTAVLQVIDRNFPATMPCPTDGSGRTNGTNSTPRWLPISTSS